MQKPSLTFVVVLGVAGALVGGCSSGDTSTPSDVVLDVASVRTAALQGESPRGNFESATGVAAGIQVKGWMLDPDTASPIYAWVSVDGVGRHAYANASRSDVGAAFPGYGPNHGFHATIPASPGAHRVCVTASNTGPGSHTRLGCRNVAAAAGASPVGDFESATGVPGGIEVTGWMADPSAPTTPLYAWVTIDGAGRHLYAGGNRPDVGAAFPGYGPNHGLHGTIPASPGTHRVCVTAANTGPGNHTNLGCRTTTLGSGAEDDLVTVTDDSGRVSVQVPGSWTEVDGTQYEDGKGNVIYDVTASWSIADFSTGWAVSGVAVSASSDALANASVDEILDGLAGAYESAGCTLDGGSRQPFSDALYTGSSDWWTGCGGVGSDYVVIAATADDGSHLIWIKLQMAQGDGWVREPILGSFQATF